MADDKDGRERQARNEENRQRRRALVEELERGDETEPPVVDDAVDDVVDALSDLEFPATGAEVVDAAGDRTVEADGRTYTVAELLPESDRQTFRSIAPVRVRIRRPTIAAATKRILEAVETLPNASLDRAQREAYEKTLRNLEAIDEDDENEGVEVVTDWIVERIHTDERIPGSRDVRRRAAKFCRANGYQVRDDEWLGV